MGMQWGYVADSSLSVRTGMPGLSLDQLWNHVHHMPRISGWTLKQYGWFPVRMSAVFQFSYDRFPYKWENGTIFFKESADYWTPVFEEKSIKMNCKFLILPSFIDRHDNQVGRWLTNFRATWDPKFDSYAVVGSMKQPRQVRLSKVCGFSIVWCSHVKSNVNG